VGNVSPDELPEKLTPTASLSRPAAVDLTGGVPAIREADVRNSTQMLIAEFGGSYRLGTVGYTLNGQKSVSFDALAGGRYWYLQSHTFLSLPQRGYIASGTLYGYVIDPMIGFLMETHFTPKLFVRLRGDAAGFGVSSNSSHITWDGLGMVGYDISPRATVLAVIATCTSTASPVEAHHGYPASARGNLLRK